MKSVINIFFLLIIEFSDAMLPLAQRDDIQGNPGSAVASVCGTRGLSFSIRDWNKSPMAIVAKEFFDEQTIKYIEIARCDSLRRRLRFCLEPYPHIAIARVVYKSRGSFSSYFIPYIFASTIQHKGGMGGSRFNEATKGKLDAISLGIAPYSGSPCRFAHSERSVGVFLEQNLIKIAGRDNECVLIQIKTSLPPCDDCIAFWKEEISLGKNDAGQYLDFSHICQAPVCGDCKKVYWLQYLKDITGIKHLEVSISCGVNFKEEETVDDVEFLRVWR